MRIKFFLAGKILWKSINIKEKSNTTFQHELSKPEQATENMDHKFKKLRIKKTNCKGDNEQSYYYMQSPVRDTVYTFRIHRHQVWILTWSGKLIVSKINVATFKKKF